MSSPVFCGRRPPILAACLALGVLCWSVAVRADEVVVKGTRLEGTVVGVTASGVRFETSYGKGAIEIAYADIQALTSAKAFVILFGEDGEARGRLWGIRDGRLLVGPDPAAATSVPVASIQRSLTAEAFDASAVERLRAETRFWTGRLDLGWAYTNATTDTTNVSVAAELRRKTAASTLTLRGAYRLGTEQKSGGAKSTVENRLAGGIRYDRDLVGRLFAFGEVTGEYDEVQQLSLRTIPTLGLGFYILKGDSIQLDVRAGGGYVYERFFDETSNDYFTATFGGGVEAALPFGSTLEARIEYLPSVEDWVDTYFLRGSASWRLPLLTWLDFTLTFLDDYTSRPAAGTQHNSFTSLAGLSLRY
jgi:hypothetical protein